MRCVMYNLWIEIWVNWYIYSYLRSWYLPLSMDTQTDMYLSITQYPEHFFRDYLGRYRTGCEYIHGYPWT